MGLNHKSGLKAGLSVKEDKSLLSVGFNTKFKKYWFEYISDEKFIAKNCLENFYFWYCGWLSYNN